MQEIREAFNDFLENDAGIQGMTGYAVGDTRVYEESPPEKIVMNSTYPVYITWKWSSPGGIMQGEYTQKAQYPDEFADVNVYAVTSVLRDQVSERIGLILKDKDWNTVSYRVLTTDQMGSNDIQEIHPGTAQLIIKRKHIRYKFRGIYRK